MKQQVNHQSQAVCAPTCCSLCPRCETTPHGYDSPIQNISEAFQTRGKDPIWRTRVLENLLASRIFIFWGLSTTRNVFWEKLTATTLTLATCKPKAQFARSYITTPPSLYHGWSKPTKPTWSDSKHQDHQAKHIHIFIYQPERYLKSFSHWCVYLWTTAFSYLSNVMILYFT